MLQHDAAVDESEIAVLELPQIRSIIQQKPAARIALMKLCSQLDHRGGDVNSPESVEMPGERRGQPPDSATEIERRRMRVRGESQRLQIGENRVNFPPTGGKELLESPVAATF